MTANGLLKMAFFVPLSRMAVVGVRLELRIDMNFLLQLVPIDTDPTIQHN